MDADAELLEESSSRNDVDGMDITFDSALATEHSYLGTNLEILQGRTLLDNGIYINLPILFDKSMILFPEQTLPMMEHSPQVQLMFRTCISKDKTFGVVHEAAKSEAMYGTTAEIYEYCDSDTEGFRIKARGRQRFKVLTIRRIQGQIYADVKILPEIVLGPPFFDERLASLDYLRKIPKTEKQAKEQEYRVSRRDSIVTPWPSWIYRQYDVRRLAMKIRKDLRSLQSKGSAIPEEPVELSFWLAQNLFLTNYEKIALLQDNCAISRLQCEAKLLSMIKGKAFLCKICHSCIAHYKDIVPMNKQGLQEAYCNPSGAIYETVTICRTINVNLNQEPPSTEYSWFPGYAWTIAYCAGCGFHIGWYFTAVNEDLKPRSFWGLTRNNLMLDDTPTVRNDISLLDSIVPDISYNLPDDSDSYISYDSGDDRTPYGSP